MKTYTYSQPEAIEYTGDVPVVDENGQEVVSYKRIYDNSLKKTFDKIFDFRYFLKFEVYDSQENRLFSVKKISRRGKLWFEGVEVPTKKKYMISYENWRLGIPILYISDGTLKIELDKELEDWSRFLINQEEIAKWKADYINGEFHMTLHIHNSSPIQHPAFFIAICQATLFVGA